MRASRKPIGVKVAVSPGIKLRQKFRADVCKRPPRGRGRSRRPQRGRWRSEAIVGPPVASRLVAAWRSSRARTSGSPGADETPPGRHRSSIRASADACRQRPSSTARKGGSTPAHRRRKEPRPAEQSTACRHPAGRAQRRDRALQVAVWRSLSHFDQGDYRCLGGTSRWWRSCGVSRLQE